MKKTIINYLFAALLILILAMAYSTPEFVYPEYGQINYTGLTEPRWETSLDCTSFEAHIETMRRIE